MPTLMLQTWEAMNRAGVRYCLLRDAHRLDKVSRNAEIDLLVDNDDLAKLGAVLSRLGFVRQRAWGHSPHHFFLVYHETSDAWLKLDVVTNVSYGWPCQVLRTGLADNCLTRRRRLGPAFIPAPEDELVTLLLHCLLDKRRFAPHRWKRLGDLRRGPLDEPYLGEVLRVYWAPRARWARIAAWIDCGDRQALLGQRPTVSRHLTRRKRTATIGRYVRDRTLRKLSHLLGAVRPAAPMVAVVAPDGAGKSTVIAAICSSFWIPTRSIYMGLWQRGTDVRRRLRLPAAGLVCRLFTQWRRYLTARYHQAQGRLVLFDRYTYDALLPPGKPLGRLRRWRRGLLAAACPAPNLVVILDAPGKVLFARTGEHSAAVLEQQRRGYLALQTRIPRTLVIDATETLQTVRRKVTAAIWDNTIHSTTRRRLP